MQIKIVVKSMSYDFDTATKDVSIGFLAKATVR